MHSPQRLAYVIQRTLQKIKMNMSIPILNSVDMGKARYYYVSVKIISAALSDILKGTSGVRKSETNSEHFSIFHYKWYRFE